jgi:hypothetical protein
VAFAFLYTRTKWTGFHLFPLLRGEVAALRRG